MPGAAGPVPCLLCGLPTLRVAQRVWGRLARRGPRRGGECHAVSACQPTNTPPSFWILLNSLTSPQHKPQACLEPCWPWQRSPRPRLAPFPLTDNAGQPWSLDADEDRVLSEQSTSGRQTRAGQPSLLCGLRPTSIRPPLRLPSAGPPQVPAAGQGTEARAPRTALPAPLGRRRRPGIAGAHGLGPGAHGLGPRRGHAGAVGEGGGGGRRRGGCEVEGVWGLGLCLACRLGLWLQLERSKPCAACRVSSSSCRLSGSRMSDRRRSGWQWRRGGGGARRCRPCRRRWRRPRPWWRWRC